MRETWEPELLQRCMTTVANGFPMQLDSIHYYEIHILSHGISTNERRTPAGATLSVGRKVEEKQIINHRQPLQTSSICNCAVWHNYAPNITGWSCGSGVATGERMKNASAQSVGESRKRPRVLRNSGRSSACWMGFDGRCFLGHEKHVETLQGCTHVCSCTYLTVWPYKGIYVNEVFFEKQIYSIWVGEVGLRYISVVLIKFRSFNYAYALAKT